MVWYSHILKNFPQFVVIHTVKGFGVVNNHVNAFYIANIKLNYTIWSKNVIQAEVNESNYISSGWYDYTYGKEIIICYFEHNILTVHFQFKGELERNLELITFTVAVDSGSNGIL